MCLTVSSVVNELPLYCIWTVFCSPCWWKVSVIFVLLRCDYVFPPLCTVCNFCLTCGNLVASSHLYCVFFVLKPLLWIRIFNVWFFPPEAWTPHVSCSTWSVPTLVPLLLSQKNWLCASQDDSLLPPTALAELTMGDHYTTDGTKLHPLHSTLLSLFTLLQLLFSLSLSLSLFVTFLYSSCKKNTNETTRKNWRGSTLPVDKPDETLWPLCALRVPELQNANHSIRYHGTTYPRTNTTTCLDNTNSVFDKKQRLWLHLRTFLFLGRRNVDLD